MKRILIVEDETAIAELLSAVLEDEGYQVGSARNGEEALARLDEIRPDLIVSDVMMPILDGVEMCRLVQSDPNYRSIPIVLISAAPKSIDLDDCECNAFLSKPFDLDLLLTTVGRLIGKPGEN